MNADPAVMEFFPHPLSPEESNALAARFEDEFTRRGFCPWAVEEHDTGDFIGFVGLHELPDYLLFAPGVEVGWRLARRFWGRGYATEAASAALRFGFEVLGLPEIVSLTSAINVRSRAVMERLAMHRSPSDDFNHPNIAEDSPLRSHVLYRMPASEWERKVEP